MDTKTKYQIEGVSDNTSLKQTFAEMMKDRTNCRKSVSSETKNPIFLKVDWLSYFRVFCYWSVELVCLVSGASDLLSQTNYVRETQWYYGVESAD